MKMTPERKKQRLLLPVPFYHSHLQEETRVSVISCRKLWAAVMAPLPAPPHLLFVSTSQIVISALRAVCGQGQWPRAWPPRGGCGDWPLGLWGVGHFLLPLLPPAPARQLVSSHPPRGASVGRS